MAVRFVSVALCGLLLSACASYTPSSAPVPEPRLSDWVGDASYAVAVDPYAEPERQKATFDADLDEADVIAIQVMTRNLEGRPARVRSSDMILELPQGRTLSPSGITSVVNKVGESGSVVGSALAFGIIGALAASSAEENARNARTADYREKAFKDATLAQNDSTHGFVFFIPPKGTEPFDRAMLRVRFIDFDTATSKIVQVPVNGLAYEEAQEKKQQDDSDF